MRVDLLLATAAMMAVQHCEAAGITKTFTEPNSIDYNDKSYGKIEGQTSWIRNGYGPEDSLDLVLKVIAQTTEEEEALWNDDAVIALIMSKDQDSTDAEFLTIQPTKFTAGTTSSNALTTEFATGSVLPSLPAGGSANNINFNGSGVVGS